MLPVRDHPEVGPGNRRLHLGGHGGGEARVAVPLHDQGPGADGGQEGRRERHVVVAVLEAPHLVEKHADLIVSVPVKPAEPRPSGLGQALQAESLEEIPARRREVGPASHQHHRLYAIGLLRGHVKEGHGARAGTHGPDTADLQMIEKGQDVTG